MSNVIKTMLGLIFLMIFTSCSDSEFSANGCKDGNCDPVVTAKQFDWEIGEWSRCSLACGGGKRTRAVQCLDGNKNLVPDDECDGVRPSEQESCNTQTCVDDYAWNVGPWGSCSKTCGGGNRYRNVTCQSKEGVFVAESHCRQQKPAVSEACNTQTCPGDSYSWIPGAWSTCTKTCGGGTHTRSVTCRNNQNVIVNESHCMGAKPSENGACNTQSCSYTYSWVTGTWGTCSKTCGGGTQSRSLGCMRDDGVYVPHTLCPSPSPQTNRACNTQACPPTCVNKTINETVSAAKNMVDVLLVVDDSGSMYKDSSRLATKLGGFVSRLQSSNIDWQMCVTSTDTSYFKGRPIKWQGTNGHILKKNSGHLPTIFRDTIKWIGAGFQDDERGILAMNLSVKDNGRSRCYCKNAALAVIMISDEDERSVGGNRSLNPNDYKPLETLDYPASFVKTVRQTFGAGKRLVVNSIIVKDRQCRDQQRAEGNGARGYYGTKYRELSNLTGGGVESICASDYSVGLGRFHTCIVKTLGSLKLACTPKNTPQVKVNGANYTPYITVQGNEIIFNPAVKGPATITGSYCCEQ